MAKTGIKTVTVTGLTRFYLDVEKARARKEIEEEFAAEGKEIIGYNEALPATFLGFLTQELSFTWRQSDEQIASSGQRTIERVTVTAENYRSILNRIDLFLEDKEWERAASYCEAALDYASADPEVYVKYLLADLKTSHVNELSNCSESFEDNENYKKAVRFGNEQLVTELNGYITKIKDRNRNAVLTSSYIKAVTALRNAREEDDYRKAAELFIPVSGFRDADSLKRECLEKAENCRKDRIYNEAVLKMSSDSVSDIKTAIRQFESIKGWRYSAENIDACYELIVEISNRRERQIEERRIAAEQAAKKRKRTVAIVTPIVITCIIFAIVLITVIIPENKYSSAMELYNSQQYKEAYIAFSSLNYKDSTDKADECLFLNQIARLTDLEVGQVIRFGHYEQDNNSSNGKEEIQWKVLAIEGNKALVISLYALDCQQYNALYTSVTWETCSLRKWLNETFYNKAFGTYHKNRIISSSIIAEDNPIYGTESGNNTTDQVFLLNITEANEYFKADSGRRCTGTEYCYAQGAYKSSSGNSCWWWLRSPGYDSEHAASVYYVGSVISSGEEVNGIGGAIRPVIWIDISN